MDSPENQNPEPVEAQPAAGQPEASPSTPEKPRRGEGVWETIRSLLIVLVGVFAIRTFVGEATVIPTGSMENTIMIGDHVFLNKMLYGPRLPYTDLRIPPLRHIHREDIVAFRYPRNPSVMFVKRVIGVGGDTIKIVNKHVYVDGKLLTEPYVHFDSDSIFPLRDNFPPAVNVIDTLPAAWGLDANWAHEMPQFIHDGTLRVPEGYLFVLGDNRDDSLDSRFWGFVPLDNVVGEPLFVYWSYDAPTRDWVDDSWSDKLHFDGSIILNFFSKTRWSRMGKVF